MGMALAVRVAVYLKAYNAVLPTQVC